VQLDTLRQSGRATNAASVLRELSKWLAIGYFSWKISQELAGKATLVDAAVDLNSNLVASAISELAPSWMVLAGAGFITLLATLSNIRLRRLNSALNRRLGEDVARYESRFDPNRSSSGLGADGFTHRRDEV